MHDPVALAMLVIILYSAAVVYLVYHPEVFSRRRWRRMLRPMQFRKLRLR